MKIEKINNHPPCVQPWRKSIPMATQFPDKSLSGIASAVFTLFFTEQVRGITSPEVADESLLSSANQILERLDPLIWRGDCHFVDLSFCYRKSVPHMANLVLVFGRADRGYTAGKVSELCKTSFADLLEYPQKRLGVVVTGIIHGNTDLSVQ